MIRGKYASPDGAFARLFVLSVPIWPDAASDSQTAIRKSSAIRQLKSWLPRTQCFEAMGASLPEAPCPKSLKILNQMTKAAQIEPCIPESACAAHFDSLFRDPARKVSFDPTHRAPLRLKLIKSVLDSASFPKIPSLILPKIPFYCFKQKILLYFF